MGCKKAFTREFLHSNLTAKFMNEEYKQHRQKVLFDNEKSMLIETQPYVAVERERLKSQAILADLRATRAVIMRHVHDIDYKIYQEQTRFSAINRGLTGGNDQATSTQDRRQFIHKCPITDCRGFLSTQWKCGSCDSQICNKCNELKTNTHECDPNNVANMELLKKDSRPCPECAMMIFRIEGCPQMFCTNCNTPWDWNTGRKVGGQIHNPHYYQFIRNGGNQPRNAGDIPCGGLPTFMEMESINRTLGREYNILAQIHRIVVHIRDHELRQHQVDHVVYNRSLRIKYLLNAIDETGFKSLLQSSEKKRQKMNDYYAIYNMFVNVCSDYLREIVIHRTHPVKSLLALVHDRLTDITSLVKYFNDNLEKLGKQYKCVYPGISDTFSFESNYKKYLTKNKSID
jgi:hypothetical protein